MAKNPHEVHIDMMNAFDSADRNTPRDSIGRARYEMAQSSGMPRSPAQMSSVKKAAQKSAQARGARAEARVPNTATQQNKAVTAGPVNAGAATGGLSLTAKPKKGLLSL